MDINLLTIFILAIFVGNEVISKVPPTLHTPLMSGSNAISGIAVVGAILAIEMGGTLGTYLGLAALIFATIDIIRTESYKNINYDILFYLSFFFVIAVLIINALYIQDAYLFHIALEINLAFAFVSFYTLVMPTKEKLSKK